MAQNKFSSFSSDDHVANWIAGTMMISRSRQHFLFPLLFIFVSFLLLANSTISWQMFPMVEGSALNLNRSWYLLGLPTTRLLSLRARQSRRCCWVSSSISHFWQFLSTFPVLKFSLISSGQIWLEYFPFQGRESWLEFYCNVSAPLTSSLFKMRMWPPTLLTGEIF